MAASHVEYKIAKSQSSEDLERQINASAKEGWEPTLFSSNGSSLLIVMRKFLGGSRG